ncbi:MAG: hypothetical protein ACK578_22540, partial [Pirellula sp.]
MAINQFRRRALLQGLGAAAACSAFPSLPTFGNNASYTPKGKNPEWEESIKRGLDFLARTQSTRGQWQSPPYPVAIGALAGIALICSGSTITQGPYAKYIARTTDYLISQTQKNGLIGDPENDQRYTYGHGFSMLFLSQVL